jgi:hypothetical protein
MTVHFCADDYPRPMPEDFCPTINVQAIDGGVFMSGTVEDSTLAFEIKPDEIATLPKVFHGLKACLWEYAEMKRLAGEGVEWAIEQMASKAA